MTTLSVNQHNLTRDLHVVIDITHAELQVVGQTQAGKKLLTAAVDPDAAPSTWLKFLEYAFREMEQRKGIHDEHDASRLPS